MPEFAINPAYRAVADQPKARDDLAEGLESGDRFQTLLGVTGSGKTATMAFTIEQVQRPTLVIAHNKTLAAQLCNEFREFLPNNAVEYFVSYYDYYQPEAYVPQQDLYIEKDSSINEEIDRLRHSATAALLGRRDVVVVASVSCIYGIGSPERYDAQVVMLKRGEMVDRDATLRKLVDIHYTRNDTALGRGSFRVRGETLEVFPAYAESAYRAVFFGDEIEQLQHFDPLTGEVIAEIEHVGIWPATHYVTTGPRSSARWSRSATSSRPAARSSRSRASCSSPTACASARSSTWRCCASSASATASRTTRASSTAAPPGERPFCLLDFFPDDFVVFIDESHQTVPQIGGMYEGDRSRKQTLVEYGFRLPSALDNRPQTFDEFMTITNQIVFVSATPGDFERNHSSRIVEQIVRPTGIVDPEVEVRETKNQIDDLMNEIRGRADEGERTLVTTLTKKMAEDLTDYLMRVRLQGPLPALGDRHAGADPDHPRPAARRVRRARRRQPPARGARPAGGVARGDPRRGQGGLPARRDVADPDDRPRRPQRARQGDHVRRQGVAGDAQRDRRDRPPPRDPARLQRGARHHGDHDRQGHLGHHATSWRSSRRCPRARAGAAATSRR